ncbi:MAG: hypothetical protein QW051_00725 [Candidatus Aenigmatarchaeota archaeon]
MKVKGISEMVAAVLIIGITISLALVLGPWMVKLATKTSENVETEVNQEFLCRGVAYGFDTNYGVSGVAWNFSDTPGEISTKIINTGTQNLYNFSLELTFRTDSGLKIITYPDVIISDESQKTKINPLKPGYSCILEAEVNNIESEWTLIKVKVINDLCPRNSPSIEL